MIKLSIDLMGGANAPFAILEAATNFPNAFFSFFGTKDCEDAIMKYSTRIKNFEFTQTKEYLEEGKKANLQSIDNSSMASAIKHVANGSSDAVISGGPSGYYLLLCKKILGTLPGVSRPALASLIPTLKNNAVMMDLGANLSCQESDLVKFAVMGEALARFWLDIEVPKVGFVNVGEELGKGPIFIREAALNYQEISPYCFKGFVEANFIPSGEYDVIVSDGFTGNCLLKLGEGMMDFFKNKIKSQIKGPFDMLLAYFLKRKIKKMNMNPRDYNGAIWAGVNHCAVKSHGSADALGFKSAIRLCLKIAESKDTLMDHLKSHLKRCS